MCCVWPDERGYLYIYKCCGASLLCMDMSTIMKILNNFLGPLGFFFDMWNCAYLMCDIVVDKRLHGVLEVEDMQDGENVD